MLCESELTQLLHKLTFDCHVSIACFATPSCHARPTRWSILELSSLFILQYKYLSIPLTNPPTFARYPPPFLFSLFTSQLTASAFVQPSHRHFSTAAAFPRSPVDISRSSPSSSRISRPRVGGASTSLTLETWLFRT